MKKNSFIKLVKRGNPEGSKLSVLERFYDLEEEPVFKIVFYGNLIGGDGYDYEVVGLEYRGEPVLDEKGNLILFYKGKSGKEGKNVFEDVYVKNS